jgi:enoyl-CoA hydratase/carnithine racemase
MTSQASPLELKRILFMKKGSIAYVMFNRPRVFNALDTALIAELKAVGGISN